jgi:hypothetical protein
MVYLEQTAPGRFERRTLEVTTCDRVTCAPGAWNCDGRGHLAVGNFCLSGRHRLADGLTLWKNLGPVRPR